MRRPQLDSPAEEQFYDVFLGFLVHMWGFDCHHKKDGVRLTTAHEGHALTLKLSTQKRIIGYRVDFLLTCRYMGYERHLVIECDGYTYHKQEHQFTSDRKRDRDLLENGYDVVRIAAKEIFKSHEPAQQVERIFAKWVHDIAYTAQDTKDIAQGGY